MIIGVVAATITLTGGDDDRTIADIELAVAQIVEDIRVPKSRE